MRVGVGESTEILTRTRQPHMSHRDLLNNSGYESRMDQILLMGMDVNIKLQHQSSNGNGDDDEYDDVDCGGCEIQEMPTRYRILG